MKDDPNLKEIIKNIDEARRLCSVNESVKIAVVVCGSEADRLNWDQRLKDINKHIFNKDSSTLTLSLLEKVGNKTREGNFLGTLLAYSKIKHPATLKNVPYRECVTLMGMLFGRGERMSPITMVEGDCKPAIRVTPKSLKIGKRLQAFTAMEEALLYFTPVAKFLERRGFRGILNKWGDETEVASINLTNVPTTDAKFGEYDLIKVVSVSEIKKELAKQKDWVVFDEEYTVVGQVHRGDKKKIIKQLTKMGIKPGVEGKYYGGISLGPVAISYDLLDVACEVFKEEVMAEGVFFDFDPYFIMALAMAPEQREVWQKKCEVNEKMRALMKMMPDFFEKVQELKRVFKSTYGRELNIKVLDLGENIYWADVGQHRAMRKKYLALNDDTREGFIARKLSGLQDKRDKNGNIIVNSKVSPNVVIKNSVIVGSDIAGKGEILNSVIVDTEFDDVCMNDAFSIRSTRLGKTVLKENSGIYESLGADDFVLDEGMRHVSILTGEERIDLEVSEETDLRDKENTYDVPIFNNKISFDEAYDIMKGVSMEELENRRDVEVERMKIVKEKFERFKPLKFGTSGLRDKVELMTDMECYINAAGFISFLEESGEIGKIRRIAIGGDRRKSTPRIMASVRKAAEEAGYDVEFCGDVPSPTLVNYAIDKGIPSIMVTGSHIPDDRNGIKFTKTTGEVLKTDEKDILKNIELARKKEYEKDGSGSLFNEKGMFKVQMEEAGFNVREEAVKKYVNRYKEVFSKETLQGEKVVLYQHSAVGRDIVKDIFEALGAEVIAVERSEKFVPVDTEKVSQKTKGFLKKCSEKYKPFAIISTDGDSDRPLLADENGEFLSGDKLGALTAMFLDPSFVAIPISANDAIVQTLQNKGVTVKQTRIGSPYVIAAMNVEKSVNPGSKVVSWESNGGFLLGSDWEINEKKLKALSTRDAVLPLIAVLVLAKRSGQTVSEVISSNLPVRYTHADIVDNKTKGVQKYTADMGKEIIKMFSPEDKNIIIVNFENTKVKVTDITGNVNDQVDAWLRGELNGLKDNLEKYFTRGRGFSEVKEINFTDGIRILFKNNDVAHLRPSGNAPEFRMYATSDSQKRANEIVEKRLEIIPGIIKDMLSVQPRSIGAQVKGEKVYEAVRKGKPIYILPYKQPKVWGINGIGEYWYGAEKEEKSSVAIVGEDTAMMSDVLEYVSDDLLGEKVVRKFGKFLPLVKILTPKGRLSVQFHDSKNELWIVTGIDRSALKGDPEIILGFSAEVLEKYNDKVTEEYRGVLEKYGEALNKLIGMIERESGGIDILEEKKDVAIAAETFRNSSLEIKGGLESLQNERKKIDKFYNYVKVDVGDVIPVVAGTLHALGSGVEVVEPQIPGPTQSLEDGETYPVRYYFPEYKRAGAQKKLDLDRIGEMKASLPSKTSSFVI
ncbi:MAG: hypothetical protein KAI70_02055, partial [Candidatus Omnitrophica bacterium]|nr:hypothetical protein [Candidatus Omnitrophota bacterium]